jgi:organic radical activating enzyme
MQKLKISELFYSIQGEGRYMGVPSVFLRTFGCNFKCAGFGMPKGELSEERIGVARFITAYKDYKSLPLVSSGCDSYASWDPAFRHLSPYYNTDEIVVKIMELLPHKRWVDEHLVITGGEPLLGWQRAYPELLSYPEMIALKELTFETNGTQPLHEDFKKFLQKQWHKQKGIETLTFSVSAKLSSSGEKREDAICPEVVREYELYGHTYLKFVIATNEDVEEVLDVVNIYRKNGFMGNVYVMPVGGTERVYSMNNKQVAKMAMKHGLRYSDRLQVPLFKNEWGT